MIPVKGDYNVTAIFGQTGSYWSGAHKGIDITASNRDVISTCDGVVRVATFDGGGWGNYISIGDKNGNRHLYCHLKSFAVEVGQSVKAGQKIGVMGSTGNSTGVHLHYQVNDSNGTPLNPANIIGIKNVVGSYSAPQLFNDDKNISDWARDAVYFAKQNGYLVGDTNGNFKPKDYLTREQAAVIIQNIFKK